MTAKMESCVSQPQDCPHEPSTNTGNQGSNSDPSVDTGPSPSVKTSQGHTENTGLGVSSDGTDVKLDPCSKSSSPVVESSHGNKVNGSADNVTVALSRDSAYFAHTNRGSSGERTADETDSVACGMSNSVLDTVCDSDGPSVVLNCDTTHGNTKHINNSSVCNVAAAVNVTEDCARNKSSSSVPSAQENCRSAGHSCDNSAKENTGVLLGSSSPVSSVIKTSDQDCEATVQSEASALAFPTEVTEKLTDCNTSLKLAMTSKETVNMHMLSVSKSGNTVRLVCPGLNASDIQADDSNDAKDSGPLSERHNHSLTATNLNTSSEVACLQAQPVMSQNSTPSDITVTVNRTVPVSSCLEGNSVMEAKTVDDTVKGKNSSSDNLNKKPVGLKRQISVTENVCVKKPCWESDHKNLVTVPLNGECMKSQDCSTGAQFILQANPPGSAKGQAPCAIPLYLIVNSCIESSQLNITLQNTKSGVNVSVQKCDTDNKVCDLIKSQTYKPINCSTIGEAKIALKPVSCPNTSQMVSDSDITSSVTSNEKLRNMSKKMESLRFPPCVVCGGDSSGYHYGRNTCEACKNFFRRCLLRKDGVNFVCTQGKDCEISYKKNKNNCSACRYSKCLSLGMSKEKCKMGRYTYSRRTETINQVRKLEGKDTDEQLSFSDTGSLSSVDSFSPFSGNENLTEDTAMKGPGSVRSARWCVRGQEMTNDELIEHLVNAMEEIKPYGDDMLDEEAIEAKCREHYLKYMKKIEIFGPMRSVSMKEYQYLLKTHGIDIDGQFAVWKKFSKEWDGLISRYCHFAKQIPGFSDLNYNDQSTLLKATNPVFFTFLLHKGYRPEYNVYIEVDGNPYHVHEAMDKMFSAKLLTSMLDMCLKVQNLIVSKRELALLITIVTMSGDQCKLESMEQIESVQIQITELLYQEIVKNFGPTAGLVRFSKFIDLLTTSREFLLTYLKEYRTVCDDPFMQEQIPNLNCLAPEEI